MTGRLTEELVQRQQTPRVYGEESAIPRARDSQVQLNRDNQTFLYPKLNCYRDNDEVLFKERQLLYIY